MKKFKFLFISISMSSLLFGCNNTSYSDEILSTNTETIVESTDTSTLLETEEKIEVPKSLKVLSIGNSFAIDTVEHIPNIALNMGIKEVKFATLYIGGCSINKHYDNAINNKSNYEYYINTGSGWSSTANKSIYYALQSEEWDYISIQHGTGDGSRYANIKSYANLANLISYVKENAIGNPSIAFNMTWVG